MSDEATEQDQPEVFDQEKGETETEKTFTQTDLEREIGKRLARERAKYEGFDELKAKAEKLDEIEAAQKSELEKLMERVEAAERERDELANRTRQETVRSAIIAEASRQGAIDPDDIVALLGGADLEVEDGKVVGVDAAVKALLESKPHLAGSRTPAPADQGARQTAPDESGDLVAEVGRNILKAAGRG